MAGLTKRVARVKIYTEAAREEARRLAEINSFHNHNQRSKSDDSQVVMYQISRGMDEVRAVEHAHSGLSLLLLFDLLCLLALIYFACCCR